MTPRRCEKNLCFRPPRPLNSAQFPTPISKLMKSKLILLLAFAGFALSACTKQQAEKETEQPPAPLADKPDTAYGIPEPDRPGFIRSPHNPAAGLIDVRGLPPGMEIKDPYAPGKMITLGNSGNTAPSPAPANESKGKWHIDVEAKFIEFTPTAFETLLKEIARDFGMLSENLRTEKDTIITEEEFKRVMQQLNQIKGVDLLSSPRATMKSGQEVEVEIVREFKYPTEWRPGEYEEHEKGAVYTPTTPTVFQVWPIGVRFHAQATVVGTDAEVKYIQMHYEPQTVEVAGAFFLDVVSKKLHTYVFDRDKEVTESRIQSILNDSSKLFSQADKEAREKAIAEQKTETKDVISSPIMSKNSARGFAKIPDGETLVVVYHVPSPKAVADAARPPDAMFEAAGMPVPEAKEEAATPDPNPEQRRVVVVFITTRSIKPE